MLGTAAAALRVVVVAAMSRTAHSPVLVAYRPGGGLLAQAVSNFDHAISVGRGLAAAFAPGLLADVQWWIVPEGNAISAGSEAMAEEQEAARG